MARILCIDYGTVRVGLAHTDNSIIIATPLETVSKVEIFQFLTFYFSKNEILKVLIGEPRKIKGKYSKIFCEIDCFVLNFKKKFPLIELEKCDESFSSKIAEKSLLEFGFKKKDRREKKNVDKMSACIILQFYMDFYLIQK